VFSSRFGASEGSSPQWQAKLALEASGGKVLDLTGSNPTTAGIPYPGGIPALFNRDSVMRYEPSPQGAPLARRAVSEYYRRRGRDVRPDDLLLTASTSEAYAFLFKLLCDPGDEILIPTPSYPLFDALAELEQVSLVRYPSSDLALLRNLISTRCKALILVNPNNPTGRLLDAAEIRAYLELAAAYGLALIIDEVFCDYPLAGKAYLPFPSQGPLVFTLNGFSKTLGLPQLKLGWMHVAGAPASVRAAKEHLEWIADTFLSVNTPVQAAAPDLLDLAPGIQAAILERLRSNLRAAEALVRRHGFPWSPPDAGWYLVLDPGINDDGDDETFALDLLRRQSVHAHAGHLFGFEEGRLVLSLLGPEDEFQEGLRRILAFAEEFRHG